MANYVLRPTLNRTFHKKGKLSFKHLLNKTYPVAVYDIKAAFARAGVLVQSGWMGPDSVFSYGPILKPPAVEYDKPGQRFGDLIDLPGVQEKQDA